MRHVGELRDRLDALQSTAAEIAETMDSSARSLRSDGSVPSRSMLDALSGFVDQHDVLMSDLRVLIGDVEPSRCHASAPSLTEMREMLDSLDERSGLRIQLEQALRRLGEIPSLSSADAYYSKALASAKEGAKRVYASIDSYLSDDESRSTSEQLELLQSAQPFIALAQLVADDGSLASHEDWTRAQKCVEDALGPELMTGVSRKVIVRRLVPFLVSSPHGPKHVSSSQSSVGDATDEDAEPTSREDSNSTVAGVEDVMVPPASVEEQSESTSDSEDKVSEGALNGPEHTASEVVEASGQAAEDTASRLLMIGASLGAVSSDVVEIDREDESAYWTALERDHPGLAYHLAVSSWGSSSSLAQAARLLLLSRVLTPDYSEVSDEVDRAVEEFVVGTPDCSGQEALSILAAGGLLVPALVARRSGADAVLQSVGLPAEVGELHELRTLVHEFTKLGLALTPGLLRGMRAHASWEAKISALRDEFAEWVDRERNSNIIYGPTTDVWQRWLDKGSELGGALQLIIGSGTIDKERLRGLIATLGDEREVSHLLARTDKELRQKAASRRPIEARAKLALLNKSREARRLLMQWQEVVALEPADADDARMARVEPLRDSMASSAAKALTQVKGLLESDGLEGRLRGAVTQLEGSLEHFIGLFDPAVDDSVVQSPKAIMAEDLLLCPGVRLDSETWQLVDGVEHDDLAACLKQAATSASSEHDLWRYAFEAQLALGSLDNGQRMLERFVANRRRFDYDAAALSAMQKTLETRRTACMEAFRLMMENTRGSLEAAVGQGLLAEAEFDEYSRVIESQDASDDRFSEHFVTLRRIDNELQERLEAKAVELISEIDAGDFDEKYPEQMPVVRQLLESRDLEVVTEYLALIRRGESLPTQAGERDVFASFFPRFADQMLAYLKENRQVSEDIARVRAGESFGPLSFAGVPEELLGQAAAALESWYRVRVKQDIEGRMRALVRALGFRPTKPVEVPDVPRRQSRTTTWDSVTFDLEVETISDRAVCPVPRFGSRAGGRYRVLAVWGTPTEDNLARTIADLGQEKPCIVLYFDQMDAVRRRRLAEKIRAIGKGTQFALIDELLVWYLSMEEENRLARLFQCALPFSTGDPYTTTPGMVPPEMFYGRAKEIDTVLDQLGTNLIYGGRQLGKTALLRYVSDKYHDTSNPGSERIVRFIDLREMGIGETRPADDVFGVMANVLADAKVMARAVKDPSTFRRKVEEWLEQGPERRIVLLLDEADKFFAADGKEATWPNVLAIKGLMDSTSRRFKVVFAGLHNVQRTAMDSNTPLAHLGKPVCIGPLYEDGEWTEARALVTEPLKALGYRFESAHVPMRVLSLTNFYPSLIQLFCKQLVSRLNDPSKVTFDPSDSPPYRVTLRHLDDAYNSEELRSQIGERFKWTLRLDPRYGVIALTMALEAVDPSESVRLIAGWRPTEIRDRAVAWWPVGFRESSSLEAFTTLLDEMVGLGVLRKTSKGDYLLRNSNVLKLLGTQETIERALVEASEREGAPQPGREAFRRVIDKSGSRSPLTTAQESDIATVGTVTVVFGADASGLAAVPLALRHALDQHSIVELDGLSSLHDLEVAIEDLRALPAAPQPTIAVVPCSVAWDEGWVRHAIEAVKKKRSLEGLTGILFLGDSSDALTWTRSNGLPDEVAVGRLSVFSLAPWSEDMVRAWLEDCQYGADDTAVERTALLQTTGYWTEPLNALGRECFEHPHRWRELVSDIRHLELPIPAQIEPTIRVLFEYEEPMSEEDVAQVVESELPPNAIALAISWADLMHYARPFGAGRWQLTPNFAESLRHGPVN